MSDAMRAALEEWWALWDAPGDDRYGLNSIPGDMRARHEAVLSATMTGGSVREADVGSQLADPPATPAGPEEPGLDVDRLARVMFWRQEMMPGGSARKWEELAPDIQQAWVADAGVAAAEYDRLRR